jgi:hypothetical protein
MNKILKRMIMCTSPSLRILKKVYKNRFKEGTVYFEGKKFGSIKELKDAAWEIDQNTSIHFITHVIVKDGKKKEIGISVQLTKIGLNHMDRYTEMKSRRAHNIIIIVITGLMALLTGVNIWLSFR